MCFCFVNADTEAATTTRTFRSSNSHSMFSSLPYFDSIFDTPPQAGLRGEGSSPTGILRSSPDSSSEPAQEYPAFPSEGRNPRTGGGDSTTSAGTDVYGDQSRIFSVQAILNIVDEALLIAEDIAPSHEDEDFEQNSTNINDSQADYGSAGDNSNND